MRNVQKISAVALGMLAGFAINKYATAENFAKLKGKIKDAYDDLSKKFEEATEPKVEYVDDEIVVDKELLDSCELTDLIHDEEDDISVNTGSIMDAYQKWNENADVLRLTADEQEELVTSREVDAYKVLADVADKIAEDGFISVATLMQVIYDVDKRFYKNMEPFADRFSNLNANYDEDTLINYGWTSMKYFDVFKIPNIESFMLTNSTCPHNITPLVEEWTKKNREEFKEETKNETAD